MKVLSEVKLFVYLPEIRPEIPIRDLKVLDVLKTGILAFDIMRKGLYQLLAGFSLLASKKCLEVDTIPGFKYSHLSISGPMHYRKMMSMKLLFVLLRSKTSFSDRST
jgi:hypothetical protein